jgi:organic radical activating enzyme
MNSSDERLRVLNRKVIVLNKVSPSFCLAKWLQTTTMLYNGFTHSCHHPGAHKIDVANLKDNPQGLHNTPQKLAARQDMLDGVQTKECGYCWSVENLNQGHFSDRHYKSADTHMGIWPKFDEVIASGLGENIAPVYFEVAFENICNFKCTYCSPAISSRWMEEIEERGPYQLPNGMKANDLEWLKQTGQFPIHHKQHNPYIEAFWEWWPELYKSVNTFRITGGEPLLSENTWKILDYVIENPRPDFKISINTNMGIPKKLVTKLIEKVNQLHGKIAEIVIYTSAESTGAQAEYSRFGMDWELFKSNTEYFLENTPHEVLVSYMTTVNILSASTFDKFLGYVMELRGKYSKNRGQSRVGVNVAFLRHPLHQVITLLTPAGKAAFEQKINTFIANNSNDSEMANLYIEEIEQLQRLLAFMNSAEGTLEQRKNLVSFFDEYDNRRGTNFLETFPELLDVYQLGNV